MKNLEEFEDTVRLLGCSYCGAWMQPPIYQCHYGHRVCPRCEEVELTKGSCPVCSRGPCDLRCWELEKKAKLLFVRCEYGCTEIVPYCTRLAHLDSCKHRPYACPLRQHGRRCDETGDIPRLVSHLTEDHQADMLLNTSEFQLPFEFQHMHDHELWPITIIKWLEKYFCVHAEVFVVGETPFFMAFVSMMGEEEEAGEYRYSVEMGGGAGMSIFEGIPLSLREIEERNMGRGEGFIAVLGSKEFELKCRLWKP